MGNEDSGLTARPAKVGGVSMDLLEQQIQGLIDRAKEKQNEYYNFSPGQRRRRKLDSGHPSFLAGEQWAYSVALGLIRGGVTPLPDGTLVLTDGGAKVDGK
jgi:hypothetical protein